MGLVSVVRLEQGVSELSLHPDSTRYNGLYLNSSRPTQNTGEIFPVSTGAPQGCVLSPLLFSIFNNDCTSSDPTVKLLKFADATVQSEQARPKHKQDLNTLKTVEMVVDFRKHSSILPYTISSIRVICGDLQVSGNYHFPRPEIGVQHKLYLKKAQQRMYFLCLLRKYGLPQ
ncbi:hypothetical protein C0J45_19262 [Silurus meridionalis]|nr:hypothetical protein C0J45_19262 [Silurus meridionalis]